MGIRIALKIVALLAFSWTSAPLMRSQSTGRVDVERPEFDATSIRQINSYQKVDTPGTVGYFFAKHEPCVYTDEKVHCQLSLEELIREAYQRQRYEIEGPKWIGEDLFVFQGLLTAKTNRENARLMMQRALEERFALKFHIEKRRIGVYAIKVGVTGAHLVPAQSTDNQNKISVVGAPSSSVVSSDGKFQAVAIRLDSLGRWIERIAGLDKPVLNATGLDGPYKIELSWATSDNQEGFGAENGSGILSALRRQTGLVLVKEEASVEMLIIDHVERAPTPN